MQPDITLLDELIRRIREVAEPTRVILFGSAARGNMRPESDLDVLVVVADGSDARAVTRSIYRNLIGFGQAADVVVATESELTQYGDSFGMVYYAALREGRSIYAA